MRHPQVDLPIRIRVPSLLSSIDSTPIRRPLTVASTLQPKRRSLLSISLRQSYQPYQCPHKPGQQGEPSLSKIFDIFSDEYIYR